MEKSIIPSSFLDSIHHSGSSRYVIPGQSHLGDEVRIRLRTHPDAPIEQILFRICPDGEQLFIPMQAELEASSAVCRWWSVSMPVSMPVMSYRFMIITSNDTYWYNGSGLHNFNPTDAEDFRLLADYQAPTWIRNSVFYQIFPDRFADGDPSNNVRDGEYEYAGFRSRTRHWGEPPTTGSRAAMVEFYGGDLPGIISHLDHITELGANALYLNPIFTAYSNHRYDVTDYFNVDPHLGGNQSLVDLRHALSERGMRYIMDIVPNHCGILHPWFQAALENPQSPTVEYFTFRKYPQEYETWLGVHMLIKLNYRSSSLREVMYASPDSVFRHWLKPPYSADGWRIDVANMLARQGADQLGLEVGKGIRQAVKEENPQVYLMGENFFDATSQLHGDCWDGVMNYSGFASPLWSWLWRMNVHVPGQSQPIAPGNRWTTEALLKSWSAFRAAIPWTIVCQQFNLIGSHDTPRLLALLNGNRNLMRLGVVLLFTYPGIPCVYYGDEIGLGADLGMNSRQCMSWKTDTWDMDLFSIYKTLIRLRRTSPALIDGGFQVLLEEQDTFIFQRDTEEEIILVVAHRGDQARPAGEVSILHAAIPDGAEFEELFTQRRVKVNNGCFPLPPVSQGAQVWVAGNIHP
jgi:alpha-glucosidase